MQYSYPRLLLVRVDPDVPLFGKGGWVQGGGSVGFPPTLPRLTFPCLRNASRSHVEHAGKGKQFLHLLQNNLLLN